MSHKVSTLVYSRRIGSVHRKSILAYMADRASDDGRGVYCSKGTLANETEIARSTVFKTIRDLVAEGVLIEAGKRSCKNGETVVYDLDLDAIRAFPEVKSDPHQSGSRTPTSPGAGPVREETSPGAGPHQSGSRTPTSPGAGPKPSLEPSLNSAECGRARTTTDFGLIGRLTHALGFDHHGVIPKYWIASDAPLIVGRWQTDLGLTPDEIVHVAVQNMRAHGSPANGPKTLIRSMQDFAAAKNAPPLEQTKGSPHDRSTSRRPGRATAADDAFDSMLDAAARARSPSKGHLSFG